jgi:2-iminoacetate synthase ThiH
MAPNITDEISSDAWLDGWIEALQGLQEPLTLLTDALKRGVSSALEGKALSREEAYLLVNATPGELPSLCKAAASIRDRGKGHTISFSPKVFIPLTRL